MALVDRQVNALYDAQANAFRGTELDAALSISECVGFTRTLFDRARVKGYWHVPYVPKIEPKATLPYGWAAAAYWHADRYDTSTISIIPAGKRGWIVAHEAAHILLMAGRSVHEQWEMHGKEYAAVYIWGVSALFGTKWSNRLKRAFAEARIEATCSLKED